MGYVDSPNLYQYAGNDPINKTDPLGLQMEMQGLAERQMVEAWLASLPPEEREKARQEYEAAQARMSSLGVSLMPGASDVQDVVQLGAGVDPVTGEPLSDEERGWVAAGAATPFVGAAVFRWIGKTPAGRWLARKGQEGAEFLGERWRDFQRRITAPDPPHLGPGPGGNLLIKAGEYSASEIRAAEHLASLGRTVRLRQPLGTRAAGGTSDLVVNGANFDVFTPRTARTANPDRIISAIAKKNSQARGVVLDLAETTVTEDQLGDILARVRGAGATWCDQHR